MAAKQKQVTDQVELIDRFRVFACPEFPGRFRVFDLHNGRMTKVSMDRDAAEAVCEALNNRLPELELRYFAE